MAAAGHDVLPAALNADSEEPHRHQPGSDASVILIVIVVAIFAQLGLRHWQIKSPRSFHLVSFIGLWLIPLMVSLAGGYVRFIFFWSLYTLTTGFLLTRTKTHHTMPKELPSFIYAWFSILHKICYGTALAGYGFVLVSIVGGVELIGFGFLLCFYGLYFGVLCRDSAEIACELVVAKLGYYRKGTSMPLRSLSDDVCALCDSSLGVDPNIVLSLPCGHRYHSACLKGWAMVGKKDTCAYCREKIDLRNILKDSAWKSQSLIWAQLLDALRMMIVWNPLILITMNMVLRLVGFEGAPAEGG